MCKAIQSGCAVFGQAFHNNLILKQGIGVMRRKIGNVRKKSGQIVQMSDYFSQI